MFWGVDIFKNFVNTQKVEKALFYRLFSRFKRK